MLPPPSREPHSPTRMPDNNKSLLETDRAILTQGAGSSLARRHQTNDAQHAHHSNQNIEQRTSTNRRTGMEIPHERDIQSTLQRYKGRPKSRPGNGSRTNLDMDPQQSKSRHREADTIRRHTRDGIYKHDTPKHKQQQKEQVQINTNFGTGQQTARTPFLGRTRQTIQQKYTGPTN